MTSPGFSEVYGLRDSRLLGMATRAYPNGVWTVYLANGMNENTFAHGQCRHEQASSLGEVQRIFNREGLEIRITKPQNIQVPDRSLFEGDWGNLPKYSVLNSPLVATKLGELMRAAADRVPETAEDRPPRHRQKWLSPNPMGARMNKKQKATLIAAAIAIVAMLLFPPFYTKLPTGAIENLGYGLIFQPPVFELRYPNRADLTGTVDVGLLITQWLGVSIVGAIAFFLCKD